VTVLRSYLRYLATQGQCPPSLDQAVPSVAHWKHSNIPKSLGSTKTKVAKTAPAPTAQEIADAKAKGMVWANTTAKVYHKDGQFYGTTKHGKFMTEDEAKQAGFKAAKEPTAKKTTTTSKS